MNEQIAKLYEQAIVIEDGGDYVCGELDPVKFAELIVLKCAEIADKGWAAPGIQIKQHFGVKE